MKELTDMGETVQREGFKSRMGFILVSAGCAIGIGNVWRFPYMVGQNGGAFFVLFYLLFLVIMGIPVLTMELAVGRASAKTTMRGMQMLEKTGSKWHIHGWVCLLYRKRHTDDVLHHCGGLDAFLLLEVPDRGF